MLDLHRLKLLREVDARGTVHGAARALDYTPSAISQQLAVLEREAGAKLLERSGRNVRLTEAGRVLVRHAATLLDGVEAAEAELAGIAAGHPAGVVRVSAFQSAFLRIVAPAVAPLVCEQVRLVMPATHPLARLLRVSMTRLADAEWAACQPGTGHREMQIRACRRLGGFEPDLRYASDDFLILLELVRTTGACALLPELVLGYEAPGVVVRDLVEGAIGRSVYLLTRRSRTPAVRVLTEALEDRARLIAPTGAGSSGRRRSSR